MISIGVADKFLRFTNFGKLSIAKSKINYRYSQNFERVKDIRILGKLLSK